MSALKHGCNMSSFIDITFENDLPSVATDFSTINIVVNRGLEFYSLTERASEQRVQAFEFTVLSFFQGNQSATSYMDAFSLDYGTHPAVSSVTLISSDVVRIELSDGFIISSATSDFLESVGFEIENDTTPSAETLVLSTYVTASDSYPCQIADLNLSISGGIEPYTRTIDGVVSPSNVITKSRGSSVLIVVSSSDGQQVRRSINMPDKLVAESFNIGIIQSPNGSTVTFTNLSSVTGLTYSLNGSTFQSGNSFSGQASGDYTVHIQDEFGCTVQIPYTISDISPVALDPFFLFPEANMIRMYRKEEDTDSIRANYENRRSCEEYTRGFSYDNKQYWEAEDSVTIQFKTNHENPRLFSFDRDENETELAIVKIVENVGLSDGRDVKYFSETSSTIGIYFDGGNTYDYDTQVSNGTYSLTSGLLPSFIVEGVFVNIIGLGIKEVLSTAFSQDRQKWYAVLSGYTASTSDVTSQAYTIYNNQVYDVYSTSIPMSSRLNTDFQYRITTDLVEYRSEEQRVVDNVKGVVIDYYNTENKYNIVYATSPSPTFRLRMPNMDIVKMTPDSQVENYNSDDAPIQLDSKVYKNFELRCEDLSTAMAFKVLLALNHDAVTVNGLKMTFKEVVEFENYENTNLYSIRVMMIQGGNAAARQQEELINLTTATAIRLEAELGLINYI